MTVKKELAGRVSAALSEAGTSLPFPEEPVPPPHILSLLEPGVH